MKSLCKVSVLGHVAADPEVRQVKEGRLVVSFPVATNRFVKDPDGQKREVADFHRVVAWAGLADTVSKYLHKGMAVYLDGRLINTSFDDREGKKHYRSEIVADALSILTWKKNAQKEDNLEITAVEVF